MSLPLTRHRGTHRIARAFARLATLCLPLTAAPHPLPAQSSTQGAISGQMPGFSIALGDPVVTARDNGTGIVQQIRGATTGSFLMQLTPGDYTIEVEAPGLPLIRRPHVAVALGEVLDLTSDLATQSAIANLSELDPSGPNPVNVLQSEANPDSDSSGEALPSFHGLPATLNGATLDGGDQIQAFSATPLGSGSPTDPQAQDPTADGETDSSATSRTSLSSRSIRSASVPYTYAHSSIREFHLTGNTYSALYGAAPGGILTAITRSGSTHFHGSAFFTDRSSAFAATNPYAISTHYTAGLVTSAAVKPDDTRQHYGGTLGGPVARRLFFFAAAEAENRNFPAISSPQDPNFYSLTPTQTALLLNRGVTRTAIATALTYVDSLTGLTPRTSDGKVAFARLDYHTTNHLLTSVSYNFSRWNQPAGALSAPVVSRARASLGNSINNLDTLEARNIAHLSPWFSNELRIQYSHSLEYQSAQTPLPQEPAIGPNNLPPEVSIGPQGLTFGTPANLGRTAYPDERRFQLVDLISFIHGHHHIQLGADLASIHTLVSALANQQGTFRYDSASTTKGRAGGLVDFITDSTFNVHAYPNGACPSIYSSIHLSCFRSYTQSFGQQDVTFDTSQRAYYFQDDIHLTPTLTLHFGVRYDDQILPATQHPNPTLDAIFSTQASTSTFPADTNNIGPRIAVAWRPFGGRTTLHAGYGIFYGRLPGATIRSALLNTNLPTSTTRIRILPSTITNCPQVAMQGFGYPCAYLTSPAAALPATASATLFSSNFRLPEVQQASLTVEHEFPSRITAAVTFRMNMDRQLPNSVDLNIAPSTAKATYQLQGGTGQIGVMDGETFLLPLYTTRILPSVGPVTAITSSANGTYNGLTLEAHRTTRTLSFVATATASRAIDFAPNEGAIPRISTQLDPYNLRYDKGLSSLNFPYRLLVQATYHSHLETPNRPLRKLANGWTISPIFLRRSGAPYSLTLSGGPYLTGGSESLNGSGGALYLPTVGRNTLQLPPATTINLRLARTLTFHETIHLHAVAEAYNLANHVNISGVTQRAYLVGDPVSGITPLVFQNAANIAAEGVNTRPFGTYTDSGTSETRARALLVGLRLEF